MVSNEFILECKNGANGTHNRLGIIKTEDNLISITNSDNLSNFTIDMGCLINGTVIGSVYVKSLTGEFIGLESDVSLEDKTINAQIGVKYDDNSTEMLFMGKYTVERPNASETANNYKIQAFDSLYKNIDKQYLCGLDFENNAITLKDLYSDVCSQLELIPNSLEFINDDIPIYNNPFTNKETNRIVLQTIAKIACSFITIDYETNEIILDWFSDSDEPDYTFERSDYSTLVGGEIKYGPINSVIIKNGQIDSENVTMTDSESIEENGEHSIVISDDYILYNSQLRQMAIQNIFERINGFKYVDCKLTAYYGKPFLKVGSKIRIITENGFIDTFVLNHKFTYDGTFYSEIDSSALTEQEISTKQNITLKEKLALTQIEVNKQSQIISSTVQNVSEQNTKINNVTQTIDNLNITLSNQQNIYDNLNNSIVSLEGTLQDMSYSFGTKGLSVGTSTDVNNSLLDNTGIRVYNYTKLNAIFNNKGSGIDKLIVTGTAQIGYLKFQKSVKNNKQITKIFHLKSLIEDLEDLEVK